MAIRSPKTGKIPHQSDPLAESLARKAQLEVQLLEEQLSDRAKRREGIKLLSGASGLLLALVAVVGGGISAWQWLEEQKLARESRIEERLDATLASLSSERVPPRVSAIGSLRSLLSDNQERNSRVLVLLANALAVEENQRVRADIIAFFNDINMAVVRPASLNPALTVLVHLNRDQVRQTNLWLRLGSERSVNEAVVPGGDQLHASSLALAALVHKGALVTDMRGISLVGIDLRRANLNGVNLTGSILAWANFSHAQLEGATFGDANLRGTSFIGANLRNAQISFDLEDHEAWSRNYVLTQLKGRNDRMVGAELPMFGCADMRNARLTNATLLVVFQNVTERGQVATVSAIDFTRADLRGAQIVAPSVAMQCTADNNPTLQPQCASEPSGSSGGNVTMNEGGNIRFLTFDARPGAQSWPVSQSGSPTEYVNGLLLDVARRAFLDARTDSLTAPTLWRRALGRTDRLEREDNRCDPVHTPPLNGGLGSMSG